jgi:2,4-dienoyl-CoA reductase-like NADH-dependent reductase (Old Yellow Enzyme family)
MGHLFEPLTIREVTLRNRVGMAPMCMYSAQRGVPGAWHMMHYSARAAGGCGLVLTEATAVEPRGMISPGDTGLWNDTQVKAWRKITEQVRTLGAVAGVQLAHAGRKARTALPWPGDASVPAGLEQDPIAPSPLAFSSEYRLPHELGEDEVAGLVELWESAARRAYSAGFQVLELHMAHGYLLHEFLSPLTNQRTDEFGGSLAQRMRFPLMVVQAVRLQWPEDLPLFVRISATDWEEGGWTLEDSIELAKRFKELGVDLIDCSSGGAVPLAAKFPVATAAGGLEPGYQVQFAQTIRAQAGIATAAVGLISQPQHAQSIIAGGQADLVLLGRELLRQPHWPLHAARELGGEVAWPVQYERAKLS